jgi:hypothetical protein
VQAPAADDGDPSEAFTAYSLALAEQSDAADIPYVVIGTIDGEQRVRLHRDAQATCSSIRIGDYLEADGEKQNELLFDADDVTIRRGGSRVK